MVNHQIKKSYDVFNIVILFIASVLVNYFTQGFTKQIFFIVLIILFIFSKKSYFWFAYLFILFMEPATLLGGDTTDANKVLPSYGFGLLNFTVIDLFTIVALIKALLIKKKQPNYFFRTLSILLFALIIFFVISIIRDSLSLSTIIDYLRLVVGYSFFFSVGVLLNQKEEILKFGKTLYFLLLVILFSQIFTILTGKFFISVFATSNVSDFYRASGLKGIDVFIIQIFLMIDILEKKTKPFWVPRLLFYLTFLIFILSATRVWLFLSVVIFFGYHLYILRKGLKIAWTIVIITLLSSLLYFFISPFQKAVDLSLFRFEELEKLGSGDRGAEGASRIYERLPRTMEVINENPIFGAGLNKKFQELLDPNIPSTYGDYHVGNFNLIANIGIFGYVFFVFFWIKSFRLIYNFKSCQIKVLDQSIFRIFILYYIGLIFLHHTSYQIFGFTVHGRIAFSLAIFFTLINAYFFVKSK